MRIELRRRGLIDMCAAETERALQRGDLASASQAAEPAFDLARRFGQSSRRGPGRNFQQMRRLAVVCERGLAGGEICSQLMADASERAFAIAQQYYIWRRRRDGAYWAAVVVAARRDRGISHAPPPS
jgi:hypothetical protein